MESLKIQGLNSLRPQPTTYICLCCGMEYPSKDMQIAKTINRGINPRRVCMSCRAKYPAESVYTLEYHKVKNHGFAVQFHLEGRPYNTSSYNALISEVYKVMPKESKTVDAVIFDTPVYNNGSGVKSMLRTFTKFVDFKDNEYSHGMDLYHNEFITPDNMQIVRKYWYQIFNKLMERMHNNPDCNRLYGRNINSFEDAWIDISYDNHIAFNLCRMSNTNQYYHLNEMHREYIIAMNTHLFRYIGTEKEEYKASVLGNKLVNIFQKYADGKALCQQVIRNTRIENDCREMIVA